MPAEVINIRHLDGSIESISIDDYRTIKVCRHDGDGFELDYEQPAVDSPDV